MQVIEKKTDRPNDGLGPFYTFFVDDKEFHVEKPTITAGKIMALARIPRETGLIQIFDDGTQKQLSPDDVIELKSKEHFKKAPRFKRG